MFKKFSKNTLRLFSMLLVLSMIFSTAVFADSTDDTTNDTTEGYIPIYTIEDLYNVRNDLTENYILMNDIDLTEATASGGDWDYGGRGWNPIGSNDIYDDLAFSGIFDGNGHKIIGMRMELDSVSTSYVYLGLFANVVGTVKNLSVYGNIKFKAKVTSVYAGAISAYSSGMIENCHSYVDINVYNSYYPYSGNAYAYAGGIVGYSQASTILNCTNSGNVYSQVYYPQCSSSQCYAYAGGIVGCGSTNDTKVQYSYNTGNVTAEGYNKTSSQDDSYSANGESYAAGIVANHGTVENCYNTGKVRAIKKQAAIWITMHSV